MLYPGRLAEIGFNGPVPSMRLKWLRESFEDYEYFVLLREGGLEDFALDQIHTVARHQADWEPDTSILLAARRAMGERLDLNIFHDNFESGGLDKWVAAPP